MILKNGARYIGGFKNSKMHGKGSLKTPELEIEGEYEDGELHGQVFSNFKKNNEFLSF
jgi:hypothetical protein